MQKTKKVISLLLSVMLVISCFTCLAAVSANAADGDGETPKTFLYGDVDGDGKVRINDATAVQRHLAEQEGFILEKGTDAFKAADVDGDGEITVEDVTTIQRFLAEFIDHFPVEDIVPSEEPTTEEPTTEEPTTEEPTTEEPTTEEPTTEEPTTEEPQVEVNFLVAGSEAEIFGTGWDGANHDNDMTPGPNGTFTKDYTVDKAYSAVQLKAVKDESDWYGDNTGNNVTFNLTGAGTFTVTVTPDEELEYVVTVSGDNVEFITEFNYTTVYAVGNGEGYWLNGASWDPAYAANEMNEVADDIWEIEFENVPDGFERQIKFAIDGAWTHNFGGAYDEEVEGPQPAVYNGDNITFDTYDDSQTVKVQLDLSNFDFVTKQGATFTLTITETEEPTTEEPTTEEPTTEEPTTEEPTTEEPTTEEPTTEEPTTEEPQVEVNFLVAGSEAEIFGTGWDGANHDNDMTANGDGTFTKEYTVDKAYSAVQLKAVKDESDWYGDNTGNNVTFNLTGPGTFTVTVTPDEELEYVVTVSGDNVEFITEFNYTTVYAVGNGEGYWLNGASWDPAYAANEMNEVADDIWEIEFENVPDGFERQIKFAIDGAWTHNFGGVYDEEIEGPQPAVYNGDNITFDTYEDSQTVKVQLDLSNFDFVTKQGATFTLTITETEEPTTEEPTTEEPTTEEPTTEEPTTEEPTTEEPTTEEPTTEEPQVQVNFLVAGSEAEIFGTGWDGANHDNDMTPGPNGTFTKEYTVDKAYSAVQLKAVKDESDWYGDETGNNVTFNLTGAGTFTVTVTPDDEHDYVVSVSGDNVEFITEFVYDTVYAVGNGEGYWLNGASWDPAYVANEMNEVADDVWEIEFENVPDGFERQIKFAIDGAWTHNFGGAYDEEIEGPQPAVYNGDNITFDTYEDSQTVKVQLDLSNFDFVTKQGATFTLTITETEEPTTEEPTTEEPTTEEPTTEEPTTEEPTTEEPTTEEPTTEEPQVEVNFLVAGSEAEIFGTGWDGANHDNDMTPGPNGTFTKDYTVDKAYSAVQLKAVKDESDWYGDETGNNVTFNLTGAGTFTVTVTPDEELEYIVTVSGDNVEFITEFNYTTVYAVGNGEGYWLNGASWDPAYVANEMNEVADDVWEIEFENVPDGFERQVKFAIDGAWTHNFGGAYDEEVEGPQPAVYNGDNITFDTYDDSQTVKVQLDLSNFDFVTKQGATFTLTITETGAEEETTEEATTEEPTTEEATTEEPTTEEPTTEEPTTEEPTTEEPTTEELTTEEPTTEEPAPAVNFLVAGSEAEIFGTGWDGANHDNDMTANGDGTFTKEYTVDKAYSAVQLKAVKDESDWYGDETGNNVTFNLTGAGTFTVTVTPDDEHDYVVSVSGDNVEFITEFNYTTVYAVGNGEGYWLNGASWDPGYVANEMNEVADDVWEIEFENVPDGFERQIKFAIDGAWTHNFGGAYDEEVEGPQPAVYNGDNITFDTYDDSQTVKVQLDLSNFDFVTKQGATFTLTITETEEPTTEELTTEEPTTEEPTTEEPTTEEPTTEEPVTEYEPEGTCFAIGTPAEIFEGKDEYGGDKNEMFEYYHITWKREFTVDKAYDNVQVKVLRNDVEYGDENGDPITFSLTGPGTFTVLYDNGDDHAYVEGDIVSFETADATFLVAGSEAEIFGTGWDGANHDNDMTANGDGTFTKEYTVDKAYSAVQLKAVKDESDWYGDETGNNVTFNLTGPGTFTVTVTPDEELEYIVTVSGDNVEFITEFNYTTVYAVGNGEGWWLNGASWDPGYVANEMTEVSDDVWEIEFANVPDGFERQIKFAIDGAWTHNFGGAYDEEVEGPQPAVYNGDNITFDTYDDSQTVKVQLDLSNFDFVTKQGATFTLTITETGAEETTEEATTEEPTTEEPTTEEPTTEEPTTEEPTTEEPTTEEPTTEEPQVEVNFLVAGSEAEIFGTGWDGANHDNDMTANGDGTFTKEYTVDKAYSAVQLKAVKDESDWYGDDTGNNVTFNLTGPGTFTVTVTPDEELEYIVTVSGDNVEFITEFNYTTVYAVGNGEGWWLNGASWDPGYVANEMTEVADDVWEIEFENVPDGFERQIKFAIDGAWTHNFGGAYDEDQEGEWMDAVYNGDNIAFDTYDDSQTIVVHLDLTEFDFTTKQGAKFLIEIIPDE